MEKAFVACNYHMKLCKLTKNFQLADKTYPHWQPWNGTLHEYILPQEAVCLFNNYSLQKRRFLLLIATFLTELAFIPNTSRELAIWEHFPMS
jgi:hypothetical protein